MKLNQLTSLAFIFALTSFSSMVTRDWVAAAAFGTMAAGFALSGQTHASGLRLAYQAGAPSLPAWRRGSSLLLIYTAITLFGYQIGQALHSVVNHASR